MKQPEQAVSAAEFLQHILLQLWERVLGPRQQSVLIVLDDVNLWQVIDPQSLMLPRAIFQDLHMYHTRYALVVTGPLDLFSDVRDIAEPVTRFFEHRVLWLFSVDAIRDVILNPLKAVQSSFTVDPDSIPWIWERTAGNPYSVMHTMHWAFQVATDARWTALTPETLSTVWQVVVRQLGQGKFCDDWNAATAAEQQTLAAIARNDRADSNSGLITRLVRKDWLPARVEASTRSIIRCSETMWSAALQRKSTRPRMPDTEWGRVTNLHPFTTVRTVRYTAVHCQRRRVASYRVRRRAKPGAFQ